MARTFTNWNGSARRGRQSKLPSTLDPAITTSALLRAYNEVNNEDIDNHRFGKCANMFSIPILFLYFLLVLRFVIDK